MTTSRSRVAALVCLVLGIGLLAAAAPAQAVRHKVTINSVGARHVGDAVPIAGYLSGTGTRNDKTLKLQHQQGGSWHGAGKLTNQDDGKFKFPDQTADAVGTSKWRVIVKQQGKVLDTSKTLSINVLAPTQPAALVATRDVEQKAVCSSSGGGTVTINHEAQQTPYVWDPAALKWVLGAPGPWTLVSTSTRPATASECPPVVTPILPDLIVRNLNACSDAEDTNPDPNVDNCFRIVNVSGKKLLKFPVVTANQGPGNLHIEATRSTSSSTDWQARQFYKMSDGSTSSNFVPAMQFFFAQDGHSHWHIRDFDDYSLLNGSGEVAEGEKHGYCLEDNYSLPGTTTPAVYTHDVVCGVGEPGATSIVHGLSAGWGDTYPSSLPDQAIDVTNVPDGVYTVRVAADGLGLVRESNNGNNVATAQVSIVGNTVTPVG